MKKDKKMKKNKKTAYSVPFWMHILLENLVSAGMASRLTNGEKEKKDGEYMFRRVKENGTGGGDYWWEHSKESSMIALDAPRSEIQKFIIQKLGQELSGYDIIKSVEEYAQERGDQEELSTHSCIVQILVSEGVQRIMQAEPNTKITLTGNFGLIGFLPAGSRLEVCGDVGLIQGSLGSLLSITGNVRSLGCVPFWGKNTTGEGSTCKLEIHGILEGYKTSLENPELDVEIFGSVTTKGPFLYGSSFKTMVIHGDVLSPSPFPGLFDGAVTVLGEIVEREWLTPNRWHNTSAGTTGYGYVTEKKTPACCKRQARVNQNPFLKV